MLEKNLIYHEHDDDVDTDEEIVDMHVEMCLDELKQTIDDFLNGEPLKLVRNIRGEFSVFDPIECDSDEDANSTPNSSWYEIVSTAKFEEDSRKESEVPSMTLSEMKSRA
jgi:hypothetical protein